MCNVENKNQEEMKNNAELKKLQAKQKLYEESSSNKSWSYKNNNKL